MKNFKEEIENSGMSFTEGGSYKPKNKNEIYLNVTSLARRCGLRKNKTSN